MNFFLNFQRKVTKGYGRSKEKENLIGKPVLESVMQTMADKFSDLSDKGRKICLISLKIDRIAMFYNISII